MEKLNTINCLSDLSIIYNEVSNYIFLKALFNSKEYVSNIILLLDTEYFYSFEDFKKFIMETEYEVKNNISLLEQSYSLTITYSINILRKVVNKFTYELHLKDYSNQIKTKELLGIAKIQITESLREYKTELEELHNIQNRNALECKTQLKELKSQNKELA